MLEMSELSDCGSSASRHEKSLGLLTTRFVSLLQDAKDGVLDLKQVCHQIINCLTLFYKIEFRWLGGRHSGSPSKETYL